MDEYGPVVMSEGSMYKDILSLIAEHSMTMTGTENKDILQELIREEKERIQLLAEGDLILIKSELKEIKKNHKVKSSTLTSIK